MIAAIAALVVACAHPVMAGKPPPPPADATPITWGGAYQGVTDAILIDLNDAMRPRHGRVDTAKYFSVPVDTRFEAVRNHYGQGLAGWEAEPALAHHVRNAEAAAWRTDGGAVAVALTDAPAQGAARPYKILVVATYDR